MNSHWFLLLKAKLKINIIKVVMRFSPIKHDINRATLGLKTIEQKINKHNNNTVIYFFG